MSDSKKKLAMEVLAEWCREHGHYLDAQLILISDEISREPTYVDCTSRMSTEDFSQLAEDYSDG